MFGTSSFSFFNFWKHSKYKPAKRQKVEEKKKERRLTELRKHIQVSLGYGVDGSFKNKNIKEMTEVVIDVERLKKGCFFSKDNKVYSDIARQIFDMYDKNGDNVINVEELRGILEILGYSPTPDEVKTILERFDQDNSGTIDFDEYLVLIQHWIEQDEEQIYEAFKVFDRDGDGFVSAQELKRALTQYGEQFTEDEANEFFNMMDTDGDGVINYEEFVEYLRSMQKYSTE